MNSKNMKVPTRAEKERKLELKREKRIRKARRSFWHFCKTLAPDFYTEDRWHLKEFCDTLQALYEGRIVRYPGEAWRIVESLDELELGYEVCKDAIINEPPRHGKSRTLILFCEWTLGDNNENRIITGSYNDDLATDFSRYTRDGIAEGKTYPHEIVFSDIFPDTKIKQGDASYQKWAIEGQYFNYKGAGVGGSVTGKGCSILIVDDPVKDAEVAYSDLALDKIWRWITGTILSRKEEGAITIMNMTRWASKDPCGHILSGPEADRWFILKREAYTKEQGMLCPALLSQNSYKRLRLTMDTAIFQANYHQKPIDIKGSLYKNLKEYPYVPKNEDGSDRFEQIVAYGDTADKGDNYLCAVVAGVYRGEVWVLDVLYTQQGMETTEPKTAELLVKNNVNFAKIESNNGGRGFARNVERLIWENHKTRKVGVTWFHQSKNKMARILSNSTFVMNHIFFPQGWEYKWPEFFLALTSFQKEGKNKYDDAPDAITGLAEMIDGHDEAASAEAEVTDRSDLEEMFS